MQKSNSILHILAVCFMQKENTFCILHVFNEVRQCSIDPKPGRAFFTDFYEVVLNQDGDILDYRSRFHEDHPVFV